MKLANKPSARFSYPVLPKMVLLEQPWQLARDNWAAEDPTQTRLMFAALLAYAKEMGIPVFSCHSSKSEYPEKDAFSRERGIIPINIRAISSHGYLLEDVLDKSSFISQLLDGPQGPIIMGGAHARTTIGSGVGKLLEQAGFKDRIIDGICILEPLRFLLSLREAGMLESRIVLDPRITIQIGGPRMDEGRLYEVIGSVPDSDSFRIRPSMHV